MKQIILAGAALGLSASRVVVDVETADEAAMLAAFREMEFEPISNLPDDFPIQKIVERHLEAHGFAVKEGHIGSLMELVAAAAQQGVSLREVLDMMSQSLMAAPPRQQTPIHRPAPATIHHETRQQRRAAERERLKGR